MSSQTNFDSDLERAITRGDVHGVNAALEAGASANAVGKMGYPMLSWAIVSKASVDVFDALLKGGADAAASSLGGAKAGVSQLAMLFCRVDLVAHLSSLGLFNPRELDRNAVALQDSFRHGDEQSRSKMDALIRSLQTSRAIDRAIGPLEEAFAPAVGSSPSKGLSPL